MMKQSQQQQQNAAEFDPTMTEVDNFHPTDDRFADATLAPVTTTIVNNGDEDAAEDGKPAVTDGGNADSADPAAAGQKDEEMKEE